MKNVTRQCCPIATSSAFALYKISR